MDVRNYGVFRKPCGEQTLKNVVIMTNMWDKATLEDGETRERQLFTQFFKLAVDKGAQFHRHPKTAETAHTVIRAALGNYPLALQIQEELVDQCMEFSRTAVGEEIGRALDEHAGELKDKIRELQSELQDAERGEKETRQELEEEIRRLGEMLDSVKSESTQLEIRYEGQRGEMRHKVGDLENLVGVFKLGFLSGFLFSALVGFGLLRY